MTRTQFTAVSTDSTKKPQVERPLKGVGTPAGMERRARPSKAKLPEYFHREHSMFGWDGVASARDLGQQEGIERDVLRDTNHKWPTNITWHTRNALMRSTPHALKFTVQSAQTEENPQG
ncbi:hypothetical protein MMC29_001276 [Sticta canariensis]|nr:hypothetical protein [Sticta canariensis]